MVNKEKKLLGVQGNESEGTASNLESIPEEQQSNEEILEVDRLIQEKEEILNKLLDNIKGYAVLKSEFEKLVDAINNLEEEKKDLEMELEKAKKSGNSGGNNSVVVEKMKERFNTVKKELEKMREDRSKKEQAYKVMQRESKQCEAMQRELQKLKEAKVTLMKQQKSQYQQLQKLKKESAQKISIFKKNDVKKQQQVNSLKDELKKKERILTLKEKELARVGMKLRACEDHITQLLKIQNRNRNKGATTTGSSSTTNNNGSNGNRVNLKVNPLEKFKGQLEPSEFDHLVTSKGLLEQVVIGQVDKRLTLQSYMKKTNQLKQLNADLLLESSKLENLMAIKTSILDEYKTTAAGDDTNNGNPDEEEYIQLDSLPIEIRYKLEAVQTDILFSEDIIDEISKEIDDCNIELDELSLRMEEYGMNNNVNGNNKNEESTNELNWEYIGREIVSSLSNNQTQVLVMDCLADKTTLMEKCRVLEADYKKTRSDYEIASEKANKYLQHLEKLREDFHDRLSKIEKQRINDVWAILKAHQTDTLFAPSTTGNSDTAAVGSAAAETAQLVAIQRAADLEKELETVVANEESLQAQLTERITEVAEFKKKYEALEVSLQVTKKLMEGMNTSSDTHGSSVLSEEYVQRLSTFWDQIGTSGEDRQNTLDYLLKCNELAQARALKDAEDGLSSAANELNQRHDYLVLFSSMLGKDLVSFLSPQHVTNIGGGSISKTMDKILHSLPKLQSLAILQEMLNQALSEILRKVDKITSLKDNLLTVVAEMWLELHDLPKGLQTLYHLKVDNLVPLLDEMDNTTEAIMEIKCKEVAKVGKYLVDERRSSLQDLSSWENEIKRLNLQRVQITNTLVALREKILLTITELELKEGNHSGGIGNSTLQTLITSALQAPSVSGIEISPQVIKTTIQVLSMKSASNPPGSLKLQDAMERVKLLLDSVKCNRNAVAMQLKKFIDQYMSIFEDREIVENQSERRTLFLLASSELIFKNSSLELLFSIVEEIAMKLNSSRFYAAMQIKTLIKALTGQADEKIMDQIYGLLQKKVQSIPMEESTSKSQQGGWRLAQTSEEVSEELTAMSMFVEENWIQQHINDIIKSWSSIPCDDLEVTNASSPVSLRILSIETFALKMELKRLENVSECFQELKSTDMSLIKHITELEEFEHTSKENRAKALSGNSKLLIEEEKFRKNAKKKFEMITEKMVQLYAKLNVLASGGYQQISASVLSSPTPTDSGAFIEVKIDISGFSVQGQTLLKGGVSKEKVELMRLHTLAGAASGNVQVSNVAAPTVASAAAASVAPSNSTAASSAAAVQANGQNNKRRLSNEKEDKAPPNKKEARETVASSINRPTAASSAGVARKELAKPGFSKPSSLQSSKQGSFKSSAPLSVVAPNFMLPDHMQSSNSPTLSSSAAPSNLPPPPPSSGMRSPKGATNKSLASKSQESHKTIATTDENNLMNRLPSAQGPSDAEIHAALLAEGLFGQNNI